MPRPQQHETTEGCCAIDLAFLRRQKRISGNLNWSIGGQRYASVEWFLGSENIVLRYGGVTERIPLAWTAMHFGGEREWFSCLGCDHRCRVLYLGREGYRCRKCYQLTYRSQRLPQWARSIEMANRIQERLGGTYGFDQPFRRRPIGMHRTTYRRLGLRHRQLSDVGLAGLVVWRQR